MTQSSQRVVGAGLALLALTGFASSYAHIIAVEDSSLASGPVPKAIASLTHCDATQNASPERGLWIGGPHLGRSRCVSREAGSLSLKFEHFFVVAVWLLLLMCLLGMVVIVSYVVSGPCVSESTPFSVAVVHLRPCLLDWTRNPLCGPRCVRIVGSSRGYDVVVDVNDFYNILSDMYPGSVI